MKPDIVHTRISEEEKVRVQTYVDALSEDTPYMCVKCETRFTEEDIKLKHLTVCPLCGGEIKKRKACPSQVMRYGWKFQDAVQGYSYYDAIFVMNNTGMKQILDKVSLTDFDMNGSDMTLGKAISHVLNDNNEIKRRLQEMPFDVVLRTFFAKTMKERETKWAKI